MVIRALCLSLGLFALYGFMAAGEPGVRWVWRAGYAVLALVCLCALVASRRRA